MILVRFVFQARYNQAVPTVNMFKQSEGMMDKAAGRKIHSRILTDLSGQFNTVVLESVFESLAEWERVRAKMFSSPEFQEGGGGDDKLIESGRTEFWTIEAEI